MTTRRFNRDRVLRQLARQHPETLLPVLDELHLETRTIEAVDIQSVERERYPDAVVKVTDTRGRVHHVHIEFETKSDKSLPWRLAVTHVLLSAHQAVGGSRERPAPRLTTVVVALHDGPTLGGELRVEERLAFRYEVVRLQGIPAEALARRRETAVLTPLGRGASPEALRQAFATLSDIEDATLKADLGDALVRLTRAHLGARMEQVARIIMSEASIPVSDLIIFKEGRQEGLKEGRQEGLRNMWRLRFGSHDLDELDELLNELDGAALETISNDLVVTRAKNGSRYLATLRRKFGAP